MGRRPCCEKEEVNRGAWTAMEDKLLTDHIKLHGEGRWRSLPKIAGLNRCGKSCRLRWLNYLRPDIKRGNITDDEEQLIIRLHKLLGNRWSLIARRLPGRTDNEIKNYWNSNLSKKINCEDLRNNANQNDIKRDTNSTTKLQPQTPHSTVVFRTKAFKCTQRVFTSPPPPPPQPPLSSYPPQDPAASEATETRHNSFLKSQAIDLPKMDFSMSFDEFFGSQPLPLPEVGSDLISPETGSGGDESGGVFSDEMMEDWTRDDQGAFDVSLLETWLGV